MPIYPGNHVDLRRNNRLAVLHAIRTRGPLARVDVSHVTNLSRPAVSASVADLIAEGLAREIGQGQSATGRKPILLEFCSEVALVAGVDIGVTKIMAGLADLNGRLLVQRKATPRAPEREAVLSCLFEVIEEAVAASPVKSPLRVISLGAPGVLHPQSGRVALAPNFEGWEDLDLKAILSERYHAKVRVENDVNAAAIGEQRYGAARGARNCVYLNLGVGLGGGIIVDSRLYRGANGAAGELGYMVLGLEPAGGSFRRQGELEALIGGAGIAEQAALVAPPGTTGGPSEPYDATRVFAAAGAGEVWARDLVDKVTRTLGQALINVTVLFDPEVIVLGGGLTRAGDALLGPAIQAVDDYAAFPPQIVLSELGEEAGLKGAVALGVEDALDLLKQEVGSDRKTSDEPPAVFTPGV